MQNQEIEKIKSLVQSSTILSASERAEWLALLDMMNDRQLLELEKILNGGKQKSNFGSSFAKVPADKAENKQQFAPPNLNRAEVQQLPKPPAAVNPPPQPKLPQLSHILNLPKNFNSETQVSQKPVSQGISPEALARRVLETKPQNQPEPGPESFSSRLKNIFSEKELPEGIKTQTPQTPGPIFKEKISPAAVLTKAATSQVRPSAPAVPLPPAPKPKNSPPLPQSKVLEKKPAPILPQTRPSNASSIKILASNVVVMGEAKPAQEATGNLSTQGPAAEVQAPLQNFKTPNKTTSFTPGINFVKPSSQTTQQRVAEIKQHSEIKSPMPVVNTGVNPGPVLPSAVGFETLDSLTAVDLASLQNYNLDSLVAKIKLLIKQFGYFDVIFNLEKSPVYKTYIQTGLKLLSDQKDFEQLTTAGQSGNYLNRQDFEKFTDLLSKIQTS